MKYDSLIFDLDGTLWDAVETYALGFNDFFESHHMPNRFSVDDLRGGMGLEQNSFLATLFPTHTIAERIAMYKEIVSFQYSRIREIGGHLYPGVLEYIPQLAKEYSLFIVSNCSKHTIQLFLEFSQLTPYFTHTLAHGENGNPKHVNISILIQKHTLRSPIYLGDTSSDCNQSALAGIPFGYMKYGFGKSSYSYIAFDNFEQCALYFLQ